MKIERRTFQFEVRGDDAPKIAGHAALFNVEADIGGYYRERIEPGAFTAAISTDDVRALWNHNPDYVLGRNKAGTLRMSEDEKGLAVEIDPPDTQWARDLMTSMKRGDVSQMSFGFSVLDAVWEKKDGENVRIIKRVQLWDVSPVTFPAYTGTDVQVRSAADVAAEIPSEQESAGQAAPPATSGGEGCSVDLLRRALNLRDREI